MIRQAVADGLEAREINHDPQFQWRGRNVTRIENLSDIVFALALGMLVSASIPPVSYGDLKDHMLNIVPVTAGFVILLMVWNMHFVFFRRYALGDNATIFLNAALLLLILFIAYPLRFIFDSLFSYILLLFGHPERIAAMDVTSFAVAGELMSIYALGNALIYMLFAVMYRHALKKADLIGLSETEVIYTRLSIAVFIMQVVISLGVALLALTPPVTVFASFLFFLNWPVGYTLRWVYERKVKRLGQQKVAAGQG
ncbi:hypothetical protein GCM10011342_29630 [Aquisalinus flavus]|uniref:DUF1211 domain-containing protein n=1 Tax=Aquisalinus flavus TaxID=1526572 RepID=A0A8J2V7F7_9PROT|nr:TMEM175 family protein [Aquisalinus flavus]MBD0428056.1 DUF1211 domain-containing protein [Aquisalinus flavus]GGD18998.1 hypothetical protein GCM10011342_29630 [Aquisalinus flavus]